jgi:transposase
MNDALDLPAPSDDVESLHAAVRLSHEQLAQRDEIIAQQSSQITQLQAQVNLLLSRRFSASSERVSEAQLGLFNEAESSLDDGEETPTDQGAPDKAVVAAHERKKPKRKPLPSELPRVEIEHELAASQRLCAVHGVALERFGQEYSEQLDLVPAKVQVLRHIRAKYRCPCCTGNLVTAPMPAQPIPKSMASPGLLAHIVVAKFVDALPLYRQQQQFGRIGVELSRTTLASWVVRTGELVQPLINLLRETLLAQSYILMDETTVQVLDEPGKSPESKSYLWAQRGVGEAPIVLFDYDASRSSAVPLALLEGFSGALHTDGYSGYDAAAKSFDLVRLYCFAHARRKFVEVIKAAGINPKKIPLKPPPPVRQALKAIETIKTLYIIEARIKDKPPDERYRQRQQHAVPVLAKLRKWLDGKLKYVLPSGDMGKALAYLDRHWDGLVRYCDDGRYHIDTNAIENAIRPFCVGRKNWMFHQSVAGAKSSANLYSLIETARANGLEPYAYLRKVFTELPQATTLEDIEALLPANIDRQALNPAP